MLSEIGEVLGLVLLQIVSVSLLASLGDADSDKWQVPTIGSTKCFTRRGKYSDFERGRISMMIQWFVKKSLRNIKYFEL